jgi:hypothetical protein
MTLIIEGCLLALCAGVAAVGYGSGFARFLRIHPNLGDRGILGLLVFGFLGCSLHFLVALSTLLQSIVLACGLILAVVLRRDIRSDASLSLVAATGLCIFVLLHPQALINFDDGLYYLQTFKWSREFPVIAGLGNLHGRLAYNSLLFLIAPLTDRIEIGWITNLLTVTFVLLSLWARLGEIDLTERSRRMQHWFVALVVAIFVLKPGWLNWFGILTGDSIAAVLVAYWVALALEFSRSEDRGSIFALLMFSAALAAMIKISAAPLVVLTMALGWFNRKEGDVGATRICVLAAAALAVWMLHGALLSGCAVYPVRQTCFSGLPWAVSLQQADDEMMAIKSWARQPRELDFDKVLQDWSWLPQWFDLARHNRLLQLLPASLVIGATAVAFPGAKGQRQPRDDLGLIWIGLAACVGFWFWSAPDPRFGGGFILATGLFGLSLAGATWLHQPGFYYYTPHVLILLMALSGLRNLVHLGGENFFYAITPEAPVYQLQTNKGTRLWVPRNRDQCWAHELPCTPYVDFAALGRVRWPETWPYHHDPLLEPPQGWRPVSGVREPHNWWGS